jgi:ABC-type nitrate/sulfonate/bicarbonate transport system permease component
VIIWFGFTHRTTLAVVIYTLTVPIIFNYHGRRARGDLLLVGNGLLIISKHSRDLL